MVNDAKVMTITHIAIICIVWCVGHSINFLIAYVSHHRHHREYFMNIECCMMLQRAQLFKYFINSIGRQLVKCACIYSRQAKMPDAANRKETEIAAYKTNNQK